MGATAWYLACPECGGEFPLAPETMVCPVCRAFQEPSRPLRGVLEVRRRRAPTDAQPGLRGMDIHDFLPVERGYFPPIPVGDTPLWKPERLRRRTGFPYLYIKNDGANPTGSLKDRASFLVAAFALEHGISHVTAASTGNAGSSMAGVGAAAGVDVTLFIPKSAPKAKLVQSLQYGARLVPVDGTYDDAFDLCVEYSSRRGVYCRNTAFNPLTIEGKKTVSLEIARDLGGVPDALFVSAGDGVILAGVYKGFRDLMDCGLVTRMPKVYAVQAAGSDAIARALRDGGFSNPKPALTLADSISVDVPRNGFMAVRLLREWGGECVTVTDRAILEAQHEMASWSGVFAEPAGAAAFAGFLAKAPGMPKDSRVVVLATGNGLKDVDGALGGVTFPGHAVTSIDEIS